MTPQPTKPLPMSALDAIRSRVSVRKYASAALDRKTISDIVDAGRLAPTARGAQPWEFVAVTQRPVLSRLADLAPNGAFLREAGAAVVVFCRETGYQLEDGSAATENILLAATALGVGSCWVAGDKKPYAEAVRELLKVPAGLKLISIVCLGMPDGAATQKPKRPLAEVLHWETF
ncbi:MAG: nitroreductase family protein [Elusimicrobiota bacterium]